MRLTFALVVFFFSILTIDNHIHAQELDADGQRLKTLMQGWVEGMREFSDSNEKNAIQINGDLELKDEGGYYAVKLPHITLKEEDGDTLEVGIISINALPDGSKPDQWKMTMALPNPMIIRGEDGEPTGKMEIGSQYFSGIWNEQFKQFMQTDARYGDISIGGVRDGDNINVNIPQITVKGAFEENPQGLLSGPFEFKMSDLNVAAKGEDALTSIGEVILEANISEYDPVKFLNFQDQLSEMDDEINPNIFVDMLEASYNSMSFAYRFKDFVVHVPNKDKEHKTAAVEAIHLGEAFFAFDLDGFKSDKSSMGTSFGFSGFKTTGVKKLDETLFPTDLNMNIRLESIPHKELTELTQNALAKAPPGEDALSGAGALGLMFSIPAILSNANTKLVISDNYIKGQDYSFNLDAQALANLTAANKMIADATFEAEGLDSLIAKIQAQTSQIESPEEREKFADLLKSLQTLKAMTVVGENGNHVMKFMMDEKGQMLLNGQDMSPMLGLFMGGALGGGLPPGVLPQ